MRRGEVRWYKFSKPDKSRPVVILTRDSALEFLGEVTVAPITSVIRDIPSEVPLGLEEGLPRDCVINLDHVQTVSEEAWTAHYDARFRETARDPRQPLVRSWVLSRMSSSATRDGA